MKRILWVILGLFIVVPALALAQGFQDLEDISGLPPQDTAVTPATPTPAPTPTAPTTQAAPTGPESYALFILSVIGGGLLFALTRTYLFRRKTDLS